MIGILMITLCLQAEPASCEVVEVETDAQACFVGGMIIAQAWVAANRPTAIVSRYRCTPVVGKRA